MKGSYILIIELKKGRIISVGKLGHLHFTKGFYVYVGSGLNGLEQRINRHVRKNKKRHWHIDYLLDFSEIKNIFVKESEERIECNIASLLEQDLDFISDFGCSDCSCKSHLMYGAYDRIMKTVGRLEIKKYEIQK